jgi:TRAP-type mannitol/chloroaromatic compound transport system permease small subunit
VINSRLSPRTRAWIDIVGGLLFLLPTSIIIAWYAWPTLVQSYEISEYSSDPGGLIRWPVRLLIPIAFALLALQGFSEVVKRVAFLRGALPWSALDTKAAHGAVPGEGEKAGEIEAGAR